MASGHGGVTSFFRHDSLHDPWGKNSPAGRGTRGHDTFEPGRDYFSGSPRSWGPSGRQGVTWSRPSSLWQRVSCGPWSPTRYPGTGLTGLWRPTGLLRVGQVLGRVVLDFTPSLVIKPPRPGRSGAVVSKGISHYNRPNFGLNSGRTDYMANAIAYRERFITVNNVRLRYLDYGAEWQDALDLYARPRRPGSYLGRICRSRFALLPRARYGPAGPRRQRLGSRRLCP